MVLSDSEDADAWWAAGQLRARGLTPTYVLNINDLVSLPTWEHRIVGGKPQLRWRLANGVELVGDAIGGVLNRLTWITPLMFHGFDERDREYVAQEFYGLLLSSLTGLKVPVVNAPTPAGLGGRWRTSSEWVCLASQAGFSVSPHPITPQAATMPDHSVDRRQILVLDGVASGALVESQLAVACRRLSLLAETRLLGIDLERRDGNWMFVGASPKPDLTRAGPGFFDELAGLLRAS